MASSTWRMLPGQSSRILSSSYSRPYAASWGPTNSLHGISICGNSYRLRGSPSRFYTTSALQSQSLKSFRYSHSLRSSHSSPQKRFYCSGWAEDDFEHSPGLSASKTAERYEKKHKKRRDAKGRAFKDVMGYGGMIPAMEAGLKPARALRKSKKLEPRPFAGKVAMYYANTSETPYQQITEETMPFLPRPNEIRTVKSVRTSSDELGTESTAPLIDIVNKTGKDAPAKRIQLALDQYVDSVKGGATDDVTPLSAAAHMDNHVKEDEDEFDMEDEDLESPTYAPRRISPDAEDDLSELSETTQYAVKKVRSFFQGSLSHYQPTRGEITELMEAQSESKAQIPSQRTALTSATATSARTILSQSRVSKNGQLQLSGEKLKPLRGLQPKSFFDEAKISDLASAEYKKAKRGGKETDSPLKDLVKMPQICVVGRSNVGKSSLLNAIMGPNFKKLRVSKTPGRTQDIHMMVVKDKLVVVDMPGYGYAAATPQARKAMEASIGEYLSSKLPKRVFILIDARRGVGNSDIRLADSLDRLHIVYQVVLTKTDKVTSAEQRALTHKNVTDWLRRRPCGMNEILQTSSKDRNGLDQFRMAIYLSCGMKL